ncbi:cell surface protein SprA, partial [Paludibacteraceae bacterium OttesenSCG-928-F17]|nr:cell surface protein SprA [Paludibacteraceae bacterium OttesenSCG-928-F17]
MAASNAGLMSEVGQQPVDTSKTKLPVSTYSHDTYEDLNNVYPLDAPHPDNVRSIVEYDPASGMYILKTYVGDTEIATPYSMSEQEYYDYSAQQAMQRYWREKEKTSGLSNENKFSLTDMKFDIGPADKIFGPGGVQVKTQGSAELKFGIRRSKIDNPSVTPKLRTNVSPDFDQKIQLNVNAKVGSRVNFDMNYNTESSFSFDQKMLKLAYQGEEDDIIQTIEAGNVSMQLNSALISGSSTLFGVKTDLKFGKLSINAVVSQQQSESQRVSSRGGTQTTEFEINVDEYEENRHFFLSHYFRDNFEKVLSKLPYIASAVTIDKVEVWVTNKQGNYDEARNVIAFADLAENVATGPGEPRRIKNKWRDPANSDPLSHNGANKLYSEVTALAKIREIQSVNDVLKIYDNITDSIYGGEDYEKIENARLLREGADYTLNRELGFISMRYALNADEVLAVAFTFIHNGQTYRVGELSTSEIKAPEALIVKMLKGGTQVAGGAMWDLMMKNIYNLGSMQVQKDFFKLDVVYRNDSVGTDLRYISEGAIRNKLLLRVMNLDQLDQRQKRSPDGKFDFVENVTVMPSMGRMMFPVLEPFGEHLRKQIGDDNIAKNYIYQELYDSTLVVAREFSEKNKFRIIGEYKASAGKEIRLNAMNIPRGSVMVTAGGSRLVENQDYTVDYTMGTVTILNQSLIESNTNIDVSLENQSTFNLQRKTLLGTHLEYEFSKNFTLGGTLMYMKETPLTTKVSTGSEPIANTVWGLNTSWRGESQWLTNVIDKLPFVNATAPSTFAINAEFAQLIPGHPKVIGESGYAYLDDFEATKTNIDMHYSPHRYWSLSSAPTGKGASGAVLFPEASLSDTVRYGYNRALLAWYDVDTDLNGDKRSTPANLRNNPDLQSNHYTRNVNYTEIYPNKQQLSTQNNFLTVMNLSFYPKERGPYNLDYSAFDDYGNLKNPDKRWGGIMRKIDTPDFENSNIEYIEFWLLDPFIYDQGHQGGDLYFDLGDVSEDILKDGKKFFENGLDINGDFSKNDTTHWGFVPRGQSTVRAFDGSDRTYQDVGLNGLRTEDEKNFGAYKDYIDNIFTNINDLTAQERFRNDPFSPINDPGGDNYMHYRGDYYDRQEADILTRYKRYNGTEGNSPASNDSSADDSSLNATRLPDTEDVNEDNTMNEYERFYRYRVSIKRDSMNIGDNYITDIIETPPIKLRNGNEESVRWYQFKIPIANFIQKEGNLRNFKSIRFMRIFLTDFQDDIHLRFATLDFVRGEWRSYNKPLQNVGAVESNGKLDVLAVNIEENASKTPVSYVLPPGVERQTTPGQTQIIPQNEQAMVLRVDDLGPRDARAVYKKVAYDMRQYKRLEMFVHAEQMEGDVTNLQDNDLTCFIRLGSDLTNNYYEYEIPLVLTPHGTYFTDYEADRKAVWRQENKFDFPFKALTNAKLERNKAKQTAGSGITNATHYVTYDPEKINNKITVIGNPTISEVRNIMIGIRNNSNNNKSGEVWVNELRMSEFDEDGGWAAMGNFAMGLSDIATLNVAARTETAGFGSVESSVMDRRMDDLYQINISTSADLGRFLPEKARFVIPTYFSYTNETLTPKYDPLDGDVLLSDALDILETKEQRDSLKMMSNTKTTTKSFNITNAKVNIQSKNPQFYDPANLSVTYAYNTSNNETPDIEKDLIKDTKFAIDYSHSFKTEPVEPFKNVKALDKPAFKIIKDINFYYLPSSISLNTQMSRQFSQLKLRDFSAPLENEEPEEPTFSSDFMWSRQYSINYNLTKGISMSLQGGTNANIIETVGYVPEINRDKYDEWRDTVWTSIKKGGKPYTYQQTFNISWNLPINKIPIFSWINLNASYNSNYNWNRTADIPDFAIGNQINSMGTWQVGGQFNFEQLYSKVKYLKDVDTRMKQKGNRPKFEPKTYTETLNLKEGETKTINHRLGSQRVKVNATDSRGRAMNVTFVPKSATAVDIVSKATGDSILLTVVSQDPNYRNPGLQVLDFTTRTLMMVRRASVTYRQSNNMSLPGFMVEPAYLGQRKTSNNVLAPGVGFAFGFFDEKKTLDKM